MHPLLAPRMLALHVFAVAAIAVMVVLGLWQLGHYGERQATSARERAEAAPVPIDDVLGPDEAFSAEADARNVTVTGVYIEPQLLVDGDDDPTPWLVTPLRTHNGSSVLVVRGRSDTVRPAPTGPVTATGTLLPSQPREDDPDPTDDVQPSLSTARLIGDVPTDLYSGFLVLSAQEPPVEAAAGLEQVPRPDAEPSLTAGLRNLMYALQWWVFAAFAAFMWWRIAREQLRGRRPEPLG